MYKEVVRENVRKLEVYVEQMVSGDSVLNVNMQKIQDDVLHPQFEPDLQVI